jgi:hypothetical protein
MSVEHFTMRFVDNFANVERSIREIAGLWPDFSFTTTDGRTFNYVEASIGSIAGRVKARGLLLTDREQAELAKACGAIIEVGSDDPAMLFDSFEALISAWFTLHASFGVPLTQREQELLGLPDEE